MKPDITVRPEKSADIPTIRALHRAAFETDYESSLVDRLRANARLWDEGISLVAANESGKIIGHALLSRCRIGNQPALALAPVAVHPQYQNQKIGTGLVTSLLDRVSTGSGKISPSLPIVVLGDPNYYFRFGFQPAHRYSIYTSIAGIDADMLAEALQVLVSTPHFPPPTGPVIYPTEFNLDQGSDL